MGGACLPAPVVLARAPGCGAARLALAGGNVTWTERATGTVKTLALADAGGTPTIVASHQMLPGPIAANDSDVYWSNEGDMTIAKAALAGAAADGGAAQPFLTAPAVVNGLLASGGFLYYSAGPSAYKVAVADGAPTTLATFATCRLSRPAALALDADYLYQTDYVQQFVTRERVDGTQLVNNPCPDGGTNAPQIAAPETVTHSQGELLFDALGLVAGEVVWADHTMISAKAVTGTAVTAREVASTANSNLVTGFIVSDGNVYLGEGADLLGAPASNTIEIAAFRAGDAGDDPPAATVIAVGQPSPGSFAADATHVYWTTHTPSATAGAADDCAIVSLAK